MKWEARTITLGSCCPPYSADASAEIHPPLAELFEDLPDHRVDFDLAVAKHRRVPVHFGKAGLQGIPGHLHGRIQNHVKHFR